MEGKFPITRRGFVQLSTGGLIAGGISTATATGDLGPFTPTSSDLPGFSGKIALEEHFDFSGTEKSSYASFGGTEFQQQIKDLSSGRIAEMDRGGIEVCILSLVGPGIQAIPNANQAVEVARRANDHLAESIAKNPKRLKGFAALALQDLLAGKQVIAAKVSFDEDQLDSHTTSGSPP